MATLTLDTATQQIQVSSLLWWSELTVTVLKLGSGTGAAEGAAQARQADPRREAAERAGRAGRAGRPREAEGGRQSQPVQQGGERDTCSSFTLSMMNSSRS